MRTGADIGAEAYGDLPQLPGRRGDNPRILQVDFGKLQRRFGAGHIGLQRIAIDDSGLQILARHLQCGFRLFDIGCALSRAGPRRVAFANG